MKPELIVQIPPLLPDGQRDLLAQVRQGEMLAAIALRPYGSNTYVFEQYWDRANRKIRRKLTLGQDERGLALLQLLRERLTQALEAAGWQSAGVNYEGRPLWRYAGSATREPPALAQKPTPRTPVTLPQWARCMPPAPTYPMKTTAPEAPAPPDVGQPSIVSKRITVAGERQPRQAYSRTLTTHLVTFTCQQCGKQASQQRFPGPKPRYCDEACKQEAMRAGTLARVHRFRARQRERNERSGGQGNA